MNRRVLRSDLKSRVGLYSNTDTRTPVPDTRAPSTLRSACPPTSTVKVVPRCPPAG